jgi:Ca2+-binding EF-hand superfamily protein
MLQSIPPEDRLRRFAMIRTHVSLIVLAVLVAGTTLAAESAKPSFESLDKNSDGKVSLNEAADNDALFVAFKSLDTNKDGILSREEFAAYQRDKPSA